LSFPNGYEDVTGFRYECWHYRFIGVKACELQQKYFNNIQQFMIEFIDAWKNA
jgi:D-alanyl-D-alanine carboxypeptidase